MLLASVILLVAVTVLFTFSIRSEDVPPPDPVSPTRHLEERKAAIYENLRDLQFEYRVGKLSDEDYQQSKLGLQKELAGVLAEIDRLSGVGKPAAAKAKPVVAAAEPVGEVAAVAKAETAAPGATAGYVCPHCGAKFPNTMKFCGECGKAMAGETNQ